MLKKLFDKAEKAEQIEKEKQQLLDKIQECKRNIEEASEEDKKQIQEIIKECREQLKTIEKPVVGSILDKFAAEPVALADSDKPRR